MLRGHKHDEGNYKVALIAGTFYTKQGIPFKDYHWYRQNPDGTWSHKPGSSEVTNFDASEPKEVIYDPENADWGGYTEFMGFFEVGSITEK
jgi:hypothetical protein